MKTTRKKLSFLLCLAMLLPSSMISCSEENDDVDCDCTESDGDDQDCQNKCDDKKTEDDKTGDDKTGDDKTGDEKTGDEKTGDEKTGEQEIVDDSSKFDVSKGRSLKDNIVKYYELADNQTQPVRSVTMIDFTTKEYKANASTEHTKDYANSYKFDYSKEYVKLDVPADISDYSTLTVSIYVPENAVGQSIYIQFLSNPPDKGNENYYGTTLKFEKAGWNDFSVDLDQFSVEHSPWGWDHLDKLVLETRSYGQSNSADTTIYIENFVLHTNPAKALEQDEPETLVDFAKESCASTDYVKSGTKSCKWKYTTDMMDVYPPHDMSKFEAISFWVYVPEDAVGQSFYLQVLSRNPVDSDDDYYGYLVTLNQSGWNQYTVRLNEFEVNRKPLGWDKIEYILISSIGFEQNNKTSTTIYLGNIIGHTKVDSSSGNTIPALEGAAFSLNGSRAIVDNVLIDHSYQNENATVYKKDGEFWLPLSVFGARYDENAVYQSDSYSLQMKINGKTYQFKGGKDSVNIDGKDTPLDFTVAVKGDTLFAPAHYIKSFMNYSQVYIDEMDMIYLSKEPYEFQSLMGRLNVMYETLFLRPTGIEIRERMNQHWGGDVHPRIMLTQKDFDRQKAMLKDDKLFKSYVDALIKEYGEDSHEFKSDPVTYRLPDGVRLLEISRKARNRIIPWAFLYKVTGESAYSKRIWKEVEALLNFPDWHPDHYLDTAEILYPMAIAFDWLYDEWTPEQRDRMAKAVNDFGLLSGIDRYEGRFRKWGNDNWSGVCNGGLTSAALAFLNHPTTAAAAQKVLNYSLNDVELGMYFYAPEGGYLESTGYWAYGTDYLHVMFSALKSATGTTFGLYHSPGFAHSAYYTTYFENDAGLWAYHDAKPDQSDTWTHYWFARESSDPAIGRLRKDAIEAKLKSVHFYDAMYYQPELVGDTAKLSLDAYYSTEETLTMRDKWDSGSTLVGIHAGYNEQSHGDRDIGNFIIFGAGKQFITDLGSEDYNLSNYDLRYRKSAEGQNTLVIGNFDASKHAQELSARAKIVRHNFAKDSAYAVVDMLPAYTNTSKADRGLLFTNKRSIVVIQDEITMPEPQVVRWSAHTTGNIQISEDGRSATISYDGLDKQLYAEIVSDDKSYKFSKNKAVSYDSNYSSKLSNASSEYDRSAYSKLTIITPKVSSFNNAVVFKFVDKNDSLPTAGSLYTWTDIKNWK